MRELVIATVLLVSSTQALGGECRVRLEPLLSAEKPKNSRSVFELCAAEAAAGDAEAMYFVSFFYFGFDGFERDVSKGVAATRTSAEKGYGQAQYWMGWQHELGDHLARDESAALRWYEKAAASGYRMALDRLARAYLNGELGLSADEVKAQYYERQIRRK